MSFSYGSNMTIKADPGHFQEFDLTPVEILHALQNKAQPIFRRVNAK